jgi:hypothetical protein
MDCVGYNRFFDGGKSMIGQNYNKYVKINTGVNYAV